MLPVKYLISLLFISILSYGQTDEPAKDIFPLMDSVIYFEKVFSIDSITKRDLYIAAKSWSASAFSARRENIQLDEIDLSFISIIDSATLQFKHPNSIAGSYDFIYRFVVKLYFKDEKVRAVVSDVELVEHSLIYNDILRYRALNDPALKRGLYSKSGRSKYFTEVKRNFEQFNQKILNLFSSLQVELNKSSQQFNF